jgi:hypothetical protein
LVQSLGVLIGPLGATGHVLPHGVVVERGEQCDGVTFGLDGSEFDPVPTQSHPRRERPA